MKDESAVEPGSTARSCFFATSLLFCLVCQSTCWFKGSSALLSVALLCAVCLWGELFSAVVFWSTLAQCVLWWQSQWSQWTWPGGLPGVWHYQEWSFQKGEVDHIAEQGCWCRGRWSLHCWCWDCWPQYIPHIKVEWVTVVQHQKGTGKIKYLCE